MNKGEIPIINIHIYTHKHTFAPLCVIIYIITFYFSFPKKNYFLFLILSLSTNSTYHNLKVLASCGFQLAQLIKSLMVV